MLHSQSERSSAGKRGKKPCVCLTGEKIDSGNSHIPPFVIRVLYTADKCPALSEVNQALYRMWLQYTDRGSSTNANEIQNQDCRTE